MRTRALQSKRRNQSVIFVAALAALGGATMPCRADVITDWDERATAVASSSALGERELAIVDIAMFDAVNSVVHRYRPYIVREDGVGSASPEAAAASAAATALTKLHPESSGQFSDALAGTLVGLSAAPAEVAAGVSLGERVALRIVAARSADGATGGDLYRPRTRPGIYVATTPMVQPSWPNVPPFVLARCDQFRPGPPVALGSAAWAADYNEVKTFGALGSVARTAAQTEAAHFWLMRGPPAYHPVARQIDVARHLDLIDSARWMAMASAALTDAYIAVFDAKYHYEFWRPVTAIRNGDIDGNPATTIEPGWQPMEPTPMHPEYPCAHCIESATLAALVAATGGLPPGMAITLTSPSAPGVTHRWTSLEAMTEEVANARVWAGFHFRSSARVGDSMGEQVGHYVAAHFAQLESRTGRP